MPLSIRPLTSIADYHACEELQRRVWLISDNVDVVPLHMLKPIHEQGGLLLGAFDGDDLVGFLFGYVGRTERGRYKHCSHMMGIAPGHQSRGIGYRLKLAQRDWALEQGYDLVTWTYDPLQSRNACLNIHKLGGVCRAYVPDYYGPMADGLNAGLPSDRFEVEWWIASEAVRRRLAAAGEDGEGLAGPGSVERVNEPVHTEAGLLAPGELRLDCRAEVLRVEVPADYGAIKSADPDLALAWRLAMRRVFVGYFAQGYTVVEFESRRAEGERRSTYVLRSEVLRGG